MCRRLAQASAYRVGCADGAAYDAVLAAAVLEAVKVAVVAAPGRIAGGASRRPQLTDDVAVRIEHTNGRNRRLLESLLPPGLAQQALGREFRGAVERLLAQDGRTPTVVLRHGSPCQETGSISRCAASTPGSHPRDRRPSIMPLVCFLTKGPGPRSCALPILRQPRPSRAGARSAQEMVEQRHSEAPSSVHERSDPHPCQVPARCDRLPFQRRDHEPADKDWHESAEHKTSHPERQTAWDPVSNQRPHATPNAAPECEIDDLRYPERRNAAQRIGPCLDCAQDGQESNHALVNGERCCKAGD